MKFDNTEILTAMVTPFDEKGELSLTRLEKLINHLLATGTEGLLVNGTTGEGPTLEHNEKLTLIKAAAKIIAGRVPLMVGTGSNNTKQTIAFTKEVAAIEGVDAALVVVPYYNKPNQKGMIAHFEAVADASDLPIFIYNIPGRTGVTMEVATVAKLAQHPNIIGIKDCTGNVGLAKLVEQTPADFLVYSGEDADALAAKAVGAQGIISVASHIYGLEMQAMYQALAKGNLAEAASLMRALTPKMETLFSYPSPTPVKAALNHLGIEVGATRLPLLALNDVETKEVLAKLEL
ncbi:4-hydroxy-tetrahydrodipicolinate synthase [Ligilactobacillus agilis]|uniref:4-hydroxy-tetrahydrodipicolinate synthase n=1 Tax=Ligilactobacillus agilis TaxID=1601 RepID=A0A2I2ABB2_9LACO|nr:4-hydroxy-tetrahydrodipicolinate synthase [Ligilactobacillus agilis]PLA76664.1 4-hydroxy-tetrahydrodipicolinate synthase [Ligilactobacillus agilis]PLA84061.1 4-hydroxy-tetrahydrodipicolinate synthase [Ligilactobacillus agilis]HJG05922.1 4-hydroxy-tetrahydrodipicolinate synthase [Ligilactobacillus agilis]